MDALSAQQHFVKQYLAALAMLRRAIDACPDAVWLDVQPTNAFWHIAYHTVFYTHFYLHPSEHEFVPWMKHQKGSNHLGARAGATNEPASKPTPYPRADVLEYWDLCREQVAQRVPDDNLEAESGFSWLPFNRFELHLYTVRHLAHHTGQLADRLRSAANIGIPWERGI
jgi:hypothetical protein